MYKELIWLLLFAIEPLFLQQDPSHRYDESTGLFSSYETDVKREARIEQARINAILRKQAQEREVGVMWFYVLICSVGVSDKT